MLVKICGITTKEAAYVALKSGADFIGFVFAPSKRQITPADAADISSSLPASIKKVGVFVNESMEAIVHIAKQVGLDLIQLHGDESPAFAKALKHPVIKAFPVREETIAAINTYPCAYYLLDSPIGGKRGGNGTAFDWDLLEEIKLDSQKIILAGGLSQENVQQAIITCNPAGVDVSSGVETDSKKDLEKIKHFITVAKQTDSRKDESNDIYNAKQSR